MCIGLFVSKLLNDKKSYKTSASTGVRAKSVPPVQKRVP